MAINPVPAHYPGFIFDGENSRNYGVYITGVDIYGAPERDTELVTIPGRNGDYNLDRGRWKNIKITYECAMGADTEADFLTGIDAFRNMLASRIGYKRLEDEINTGEYRQAVFADGFDVDYIDPKAAAFSVVFECKPQRFLTSGEAAVTVTSGDTITNETLYEAAPVLEVTGYGTMQLGNETITVNNTALSEVPVFDGDEQTVTSLPDNTVRTYTLKHTDLLAAGDPIYLSGIKETIKVSVSSRILSVTLGTRTGVSATKSFSGKAATFNITANPVTLSYGTAATWSTNMAADIDDSGGTLHVESYNIDYAYDGDDTITVTFVNGYDVYGTTLNQEKYTIPPLFANVTLSTSLAPTIIDLSIGEAYRVSLSPIGYVTILEPISTDSPYGAVIATNGISTGDTIDTTNTRYCRYTMNLTPVSGTAVSVSPATRTDTHWSVTATVTDGVVEFVVDLDNDFTMTYGTTDYKLLGLESFTVTFADSTTKKIGFEAIQNYDGIRAITYSVQKVGTDKDGFDYASAPGVSISELRCNSTVLVPGDTYVSVNDIVELPAKLPTIPPGITPVTFDNTITQFKIVPRWWKL